MSPADDTVSSIGGAGSLTLTNNPGKRAPAAFDVFSLTAPARRFRRQQPPDARATTSLSSTSSRSACACPPAGIVQFAINTFGERAHPDYPAEFDIYVDSNNDGTPDYVIYTCENGGFGVPGQNVGVRGQACRRHDYLLLLHRRRPRLGQCHPHRADGRTGPDANVQVQLLGLRLRQLLHRHLHRRHPEHDLHPGHAALQRRLASGAVPINGSVKLAITAPAGGSTASPSQTGLLLMYRDAKPKAEASTIVVTP